MISSSSAPRATFGKKLRLPRDRPPRKNITATQWMPWSSARPTASKSPVARATICCDCTFLSFASWSRYCAARSNSSCVAACSIRSARRAGDDVAATLQEQHGVLEIPRVVFRADEPDAGSAAPLDLVLEAWPTTILEEAVLALAQLEQFLELIQRFAHGSRVRIRAEQLRFGRARPAVESEPREPMLRVEPDVGIALVVAQHHVEAWPMLLDEVVLEHQRFDFRARDGDLDSGDAADHRDGFRVVRAATLEVARHAALQISRLADVDHLAPSVEHAVDARLVRQVRKHGRWIE